jgi:hypothetical protein
MSGSQRKLVADALLLVAGGIALGFAQAALARYNTLPVLQYRAHRVAAELGAQRGPSDVIEAADHQSYTHTRVIDAHTHLIKVATVLLLVALVYPLISLPEKRKRTLGLMLVAGNCMFPLGVLAEIYVQGRTAQALAATGAALIIVAFAGMLWGLLQGTAVRATSCEISNEYSSGDESCS